MISTWSPTILLITSGDKISKIMISSGVLKGGRVLVYVEKDEIAIRVEKKQVTTKARAHVKAVA